MNGDDARELWENIHSQIEATSTAVKVIDFIVTHWWMLLTAALVIMLWPRRRSS